MSFQNSTDFQENYVPVNRLYTKLTADIDENVTIINVESTDGFPNKGWFSIDNEVFFYDVKTPTAFGDSTHPVERGADNTTPAAHSSGSRVSQRINSAVFHEIMKSVKKRREFILSAAEVMANTTSEQNISGFASRSRTGEFVIVPTGGSQEFYAELYRTNAFKAIDRLYKTVALYTIETTLSQDANIGVTVLFVNDTSNFILDEIIVVGDFPNGTYDFGVIKEIDDGASITLYDPIENSYSAGSPLIQAFKDQNDFYYEDLNWNAELHTRIINIDPDHPVSITFKIIAEVSDEA